MSITTSLYNIKIEDKTEFQLSSVTFKSPVFLDVHNTDSKIINPSVVIKDSKFTAEADNVNMCDAPGTGSNRGSSIKFRIRNLQRLTDNSCKSAGRVTISGNTFGFVSKEDLEFRGGDILQ